MGLQFRLTDVFADNGMISVVILEQAGTDMLIDTWLMSCRVLERGVENAVLNEIVHAAKARGVTRIVGEYIATPRNGMVSDLLERLGFAALAQDPERGATSWALDIASYQPFAVKLAVDRATP